jgi:hypothetical protein
MPDLRLEIQKRYTLNWLIQGASMHAGMTFHHLVRDELNALNSELLRCYDQFALLGVLQYWRGMVVLHMGRPARFWKRVATEPTHPFYGHPLLSKYGGMLAKATKQRALKRCQEKGVYPFPVAFSIQILGLVSRLRTLEEPHRPQLLRLAKEIASTVWGIPSERLEAELSERTVLPGDIFPAQNYHGGLLKSCVIGYGGVVRRQGELIVSAKGTTWQVLAKELVKGTAELICLHGLNRLDDTMYQRILEATDWIDLEPWMLQSGGELWRRVLTALPDGCSIARVLMNLARLPAGDLESVLAPVIEEADQGRKLLAPLAV